MVTTGYSDTFNRTVANGFGTASDGHPYTLTGTATQFSVTPSTGSIAITTAGNQVALVDLRTQQVDITGQVALSSIPVTNLATVGFVTKSFVATTGYIGTLMVAVGGAMSIRFSKFSGGLITLTTIPLGLTYVANTFYNLRFQSYWSRTYQTNFLSAKVWLTTATEPRGWQATFTADNTYTDYTAGTQVGVYTRDESTVLGTITARFRNVATRSYSLPLPGSSETMCADPSIPYPKQTALESIADAADAAMATIDPLSAAARLSPRVRISNTNLPVVTTVGGPTLTYNATEFNIATGTNLGYDNTSAYLPVGIWLVTFEVLVAEAASDRFTVSLFGGGTTPGFSNRVNPSVLDDRGVGGTCHASVLALSTDPTTPIAVGASIAWANTSTTYTIKYMALTAIKISDYFA